eukprot:5899091-Alexandrium_andersonii.AAC.1
MRRSPVPSPKPPQTFVAAQAALAVAAAARRTRSMPHAPPVSAKHCSAVPTSSAVMRARPTGASD